MKNYIYCTLVLLTLSSNVFAAQGDEEIPSQREHWRKAMRETDRAWNQSKEDYQTGMEAYYFHAYEYDLYDKKFNDLQTRINMLEAQNSKVMPEGLNDSTKQAWERKNNNNNIEIKKLQSELSDIEKQRNYAESKLNRDNLTVLQGKLNGAAQSAYLNASSNDKKDIHRGEKILSETNNLGASSSVIKDISNKANKQAMYDFETKYPNEKIPSTRKVATATSVNKNVIKTDVATSTEVATSIEVKKKENAVSLEKTKTVIESDVEKKVVTTDDVNTADCDKAKVEIVKLLLSKDQNPKAFSDMVYLAQLKMAYRLAASKPPYKTIEDYINQNKLQAEIKNSNSSKDDSFNTALNKLYEQYGEKNDIAKQKLFNQPTLSYNKTLLNNDSASAVILYLSTHEKDPKIAFSEQDAAAVWAQQKLIKDKGYQAGSAQYNLMNFSTRVCQMFKDKACSDGKGNLQFDETKIQSDYDKLNKKLESSIQAAGKSMVQKYPKCFNKESCDTNKPLTLGASDIESIKGKISELVGKGSLGDGDTKVEVDATQTTAKDGNLTIYLKNMGQ